MKTSMIWAVVLGSCLVTFVASVLFSINMGVITPENLAEVMKKDPVVFMETLQDVAKQAQVGIKKKEAEKAMQNPVDIKTKGRVTFGDKSAPVTIVEYSDFQCPYCSRAAERVKSLIAKYDGKVKAVYKHFPLDFHPFAQPAAEYFEAIAMIDQAKAIEFHDKIFEEFQLYAKLKTEEEIKKAIDSLIKKLGLKMEDVKKNLEAGKKVVAMDMEEASKLGVRGTPTFFVNGVPARNIGLEELIEKFLNKGTS